MYPGLCAEAKLHLWRSVGLPTLTYGLCALPLTPPSAKMAEKAQSDLMKTVLLRPSKALPPFSLSERSWPPSCLRLDIRPMSVAPQQTVPLHLPSEDTELLPSFWAAYCREVTLLRAL